jgi:hypothetical protein
MAPELVIAITFLIIFVLIAFKCPIFHLWVLQALLASS